MSKKRKIRLWRRIGESIQSVPHLFGKLVVGWCILWGTAFSLYALRILSRTGNDPAALLGVILAFLGGELMLLCLKRILGEK